MARAYRGFSTKQTPQSQPIPGSSQTPNSAGGFTWTLDKWKLLDRFLILGSEGGTYYINEQKLTRDNALNVMACIVEDGTRAVDRIVEISRAGRASRNDPAIFALALAISADDVQTRRAAEIAVPQVCRIGTHLFHFADYASQFRGWGPLLQRAVRNWYDGKSEDRLVDQLIKYRQRDGWSHRDLIRLSMPYRHKPLYNWVKGTVKGEPAPTPDNATVQAYEELQTLSPDKDGIKRAIELIVSQGLPREALPTAFLNEAAIWEALLIDMPMEAMVRNLGNMSKVGLLQPLSAAAKTVADRLGDQARITNSRIHPLKLLVAQRVYASGKGVRGSGTWTTVTEVVDALDAAFYTAFKNVEPTGKNIMMALDVSGSMMAQMANLPLTFREASAAMAMVTQVVEPSTMVVGFTSGDSNRTWRDAALTVLPISGKQRLGDVIKAVSGLPFGGTDCALPMLYASEEKLPIDGFVVYTDSETWAGSIHPSQALAQYREQSGRAATLTVVGMAANQFTIADPNDPGMMDVVGFDTDAPQMISDFIAGRI